MQAQVMARVHDEPMCLGLLGGFRAGIKQYGMPARAECRRIAAGIDLDPVRTCLSHPAKRSRVGLHEEHDAAPQCFERGDRGTFIFQSLFMKQMMGGSYWENVRNTELLTGRRVRRSSSMIGSFWREQ